jgi:hypothetical protein
MPSSVPFPPYMTQTKLHMSPQNTTSKKHISPTAAASPPKQLTGDDHHHNNNNNNNNNNKPMLASEIDMGKMSFSDLRTNSDSGRRSVYVNYSNRKFPVLQTPWLTSWGVESSAKFTDEQSPAGSPPKLSVSLTIDHSMCDGEHPGAPDEVKAFETFLHDMGTKLVQMGCSRSMELFRKRDLDEVTVREAMFNPLVRTSDKGVKRFKVHFSNYNPPVVYAEDLAEVPPEEWETVVTGRMKVRAIIECKPIWFMSSNKYGCKWEVRQLHFAPLSSTLSFDTNLFDSGKVSTELDVSGVTFSDLKVDPKTNVKKILLNAPQGGPLRLQTPWLGSYDGVAPPPPEYVKEGDVLKYSVKCPLKSDSASVDEAQLRDILLALDEHVLDYAEANSLKLFKKQMGKEVLRALYTPLLREDYPALKASAPIYDGEWGFAAYNETGKRESTDLHEKVTGRMQCRMILQNKGIWFSGARSFGCSWKISQMEYKKNEMFSIKEYAFREATPLSAPDEMDHTDDNQDSQDDEYEVVDSDME